MRRSRPVPFLLAAAVAVAMLPVTAAQWTSADDAARTAGIDFTHAFHHGPEQAFYEATGGGACWGDMDADGDMDLYLVDSLGPADGPRGGNVLYRNDAGSFTDVTAAWGAEGTGFGQGCIWGDYDNDGRPDLYVTYSVQNESRQRNVLFHNMGDHFDDVTDAAGVDGQGAGDDACVSRTADGDQRCWSLSAAWLDFDLDGDLDLYVAQYLEMHVDACVIVYDGSPSSCHGQPNRLYRNNGDGTFTDVARAAGVQRNEFPTGGRSMGVVASDINGDAMPDLYVTNDMDGNALYLNRGDGTFASVASARGVDAMGPAREDFPADVGLHHRAGMGVDAQDFSGDGLVDLLSTHVFIEWDAVYQSHGEDWVDIGGRLGALGHAFHSIARWGGGYWDFDLDQDTDLLIAAGDVRNGTIEFFENDGTGRLGAVVTTPWPFRDPARGANHRALAAADFDNDGDLDFVATALPTAFNTTEPTRLIRNHITGTGSEQAGNPNPDGGWLRVTLIGTENAREPIGARVAVTTDDGTQHRWLTSGGSYVSGHDPRLLFGLGDAKDGTIQVTWPGGMRSTVPFERGADRGIAMTIVESAEDGERPDLMQERAARIASSVSDERLQQGAPTPGAFAGALILAGAAAVRRQARKRSADDTIR